MRSRQVLNSNIANDLYQIAHRMKSSRPISPDPFLYYCLNFLCRTLKFFSSRKHEIYKARKLFYLFFVFSSFRAFVVNFFLYFKFLADSFLFDTQVAYSYISLIKHAIFQKTEIRA